MADNLMSVDVGFGIKKIKAIRPQIIVTGTVEKPYYEILYYDTSDNVWHIGYSSYNLANVIRWKEECFEVVGEIEGMQPTADVVEVVRCKDCGFNVSNMKKDPLDITDYSGDDIVCSYFMTDGMHPNDYCSRGKSQEEGET